MGAVVFQLCGEFTKNTHYKGTYPLVYSQAPLKKKKKIPVYTDDVFKKQFSFGSFRIFTLSVLCDPGLETGPKKKIFLCVCLIKDIGTMTKLESSLYVT